MAKVNDTMAFTKDWSKMNPPDFPAYEDDEAQVRADMQLLFNELRDFINQKLIPALNDISALEIKSESGKTMQEEFAGLAEDISGLHDQIRDATIALIPDNSVTGAKLVAKAAGFVDVSDRFTFTEQNMGGQPSDLSSLRFLYSKALGMIFVTGTVAFTDDGSSSPYMARYDITGPFRYNYFGESIFNCRSDYGTPFFVFSTVGTSSAQMDFRFQSTPQLYNGQAFMYVSGWFFCTEVTT